jgi:alanine racemase
MLVLGLAPDAAVSAAVQANVALCIWSEAQLRDIERAANALRKRAIVHVKVNSGMTRLGVDDERSLVALAKRLRECHDQGSVQWRGVFTHIACGDAEDAAPTLEQLERFSRAVDSVRNLNLLPSSTFWCMRPTRPRRCVTRTVGSTWCASASRSTGWRRVATTRRRRADVKPALSWFANIAQRRALQRGTPVSYGWTYRAQWDNELHLTLSVGYADGFRRCANNKVVSAASCATLSAASQWTALWRACRAASRRTPLTPHWPSSCQRITPPTTLRAFGTRSTTR